MGAWLGRWYCISNRIRYLISLNSLHSVDQATVIEAGKPLIIKMPRVEILRDLLVNRDPGEVGLESENRK